MTFKQHHSITTALKGPFVLCKVRVKPVNGRYCVRKTVACGFKAVGELQRLKLDQAVYCGADVTDQNGVIVAELE